MRKSLLLAFLLCSVLHAAPPHFIPAQVVDLPRPAAAIDAEMQKLLEPDGRRLVVFDVHGIFTTETAPSAEGDVHLSNRLIPTLKNAIRKNARILAVSAHDQPDILYSELESLRYGHEKGDTVFADFTKHGPTKREDGILLLPFKDGSFKIIHYTQRGDIVSAGIPNVRYKREKVAAVLFSLLSPDGAKALSFSRDVYEKLMVGMRQIASEGAALVAIRAGKFFPAKCTNWETVPVVEGALLEIAHSRVSTDVFADRLNEAIENKVCGVIKQGRRTFPNGKPSAEQKQAIKEDKDTRDLVAKLMEETRKLSEFFKPADIEKARRELFDATHNIQLFYIEDEFGNLTNFQTDIKNSGYFEDSKIYLEHVKTASKDTELTSRELDDRIEEHPVKKRSMEGDIK